MPENPSQLQKELRQQAPFRSSQQEATLAILRTAEVLRRRLSHVVGPHGVTFQQYNVLRILRGNAPDPLPTLEIASRMIEQTPGVTRLLDRLEEKGLVRRQRCNEDRRMVHCWITDSGMALLASLDDAVDAAHQNGMAGLEAGEVEELNHLLEEVRSGHC